MKILLLTGVMLISGAFANLKAQNNEENKKEEHLPLMKRVEGSSSTDSKTIIQSKEKSEDLPDPSNRVINSGNSTNSVDPRLKPATKTNSSQELSQIKYSLDNQNGTLTNLLILIEIKEKVNKSGNQELLSSQEYKTLLSDIKSLRNEFDSSVESKGIENCSTLEQSHYLAFLKEEGKDGAYQEAMNKLK